MRIFTFLLAFAFHVSSCQDGPLEAFTSPDPDPPATVTCDTCHYPLVMVHGFLASGDTYAQLGQLFTSNGYGTDLIYAFDWNSVQQFGGNNVAALDAFINGVLTQTGAPKVRLMGHSAGGGLGYNYLADAARAAKVEQYVHLASNAQSGLPGPATAPVPTLNVWSTGDNVVSGGNIPGATNVMLTDQDHYQVATSTATFAAIYAFFHGMAPASLTITPQALACLAGRVVTFGENTPVVGAQIDIYPLDAATAQRLTPGPWQTWYSDSLGYWGATNVDTSLVYEFVVTPPTGRVIHYYREKANHVNTLVYFRTLPPPTSLPGLILGGLPNTPNQSVVTVFSANQAVIHPRDTLMVNGATISTPALASPSKSAIAWFLYDDGDGNTELTAIPTFAAFPFLNGVDYFFQTTTPAVISLSFNGRILNLPNRKSSEGVMVAVF